MSERPNERPYGADYKSPYASRYATTLPQQHFKLSEQPARRVAILEDITKKRQHATYNHNTWVSTGRKASVKTADGYVDRVVFRNSAGDTGFRKCKMTNGVQRWTYVKIKGTGK